MPLTVEELTQELRDVAFQVSSAQERSEERDLVLTAHESVERVGRHYRELMEASSEMERMKLERQLGRRIIDLKRQVSLLPRIGTHGDSTPDRQTGPSLAGERRITGVSWGAGSRGSGVNNGLRVGGDVDAWCGPCGTMTTHSIIAMVGSEPKQVVCQACNQRHNFRTTPARRSPQEESQPVVGGGGSSSGGGRGDDRKTEEQRNLARELQEAQNVRDFDPKERYKSGEIIYHPDFGRGKVETVLRASMLVRFAQGGLKPLMLN